MNPSAQNDSSVPFLWLITLLTICESQVSSRRSPACCWTTNLFTLEVILSSRLTPKLKAEFLENLWFDWNCGFLWMFTASFVRFSNGASPSLLFSPSIHSPHHLYAPLGRNPESPLSINTPSLPRLQIGDVLIPPATFLRLNKLILL